MFRWLVSHSLAAAWAPIVDQVTKPYQFALRWEMMLEPPLFRWTGAVLNDSISRAAFLCKLRDVAPAIVPFACVDCGQRSEYQRCDDDGSATADAKRRDANKATPWPPPFSPT